MTRRIVIVGAGAVGGYFGAYLARGGRDVTLVDAWPEHVDAIRAGGLHLSGMTPEKEMTVEVPALHVSDVQALSKERPVDIAIIAVKSYDTAWATTLIRPYLSADGYVVSAQNCINEETIAGVVGWGRTLGCMVGNNFTVDLYEPGRIRRTMPRNPPVPSLEVGEVHGRITSRVEEIVRLLEPVDRVAPTRNLWGVRWSKLCVNGMRNGVSAATGLGGNERDGHDVIRRVVIRLAGEGVRVGRALGYALEPMLKLDPALWLSASEGDRAALTQVEASMIAGTKAGERSDLHRPSMAQDMAKGRRTEIDFMNGFIAGRAKECGLTAPTHEALTAIVKRVERGEIPPRPENLFELETRSPAA